VSRIQLRLTLVLALCIAALGIASCGGDDGGGDEDPQELLEATFSNQEEITSGVFDVSVDVATEGGENAGTFDGSLSGPFQSTDGGFPEFDLDAELDLSSDVQDFSGEAGVTSAGGSAFVNFQGTDYEVPADAFEQFTQTYAQLQQQSESEEQGGNLLSSLGIDPTGWLTDLENEGTEDVEGTETVKISGSADVPKLVEDLRTIAENAPKAVGRLSQQDLGDLDELTDLVESADFSFYTGSDDDLLRKVEATLELNPPDTEGAPDTVGVDFSLTLSELNEPQEISAPADAQPLQGLLDSLGLQIPGTGGGGGASALPEAGGTATPPSDDATSAYLECLSTAEGDEATQQCAELLQ
jgi:hypothetical protein